MKKAISLLLAFVLCVSLCACGSAAAPETPSADISQNAPTIPPIDMSCAGYWELIRVDSDNPDVRATEDEVSTARKQGIPMYLKLLEDGTGVLCLDELSAIIWNNATITVVGGETFSYVVTEDQLLIDMQELTCVFMQGEKPGSRSSEMEDAGFVDFMEKWETYPYTTLCAEDESKTTTGEAAVIAYEIFSSAQDYPEKEGYEWRVMTIEVRFFDENAQMYGASPFHRFEDYYCVQLHDDTLTEQEPDAGYACYTATRIFRGEEVETSLRIRDSWSNWRKDANGNDECFYSVEFAFHVPEGYDGAVAGLEDGRYLYPEDYYITDCDPVFFLLFRLN